MWCPFKRHDFNGVRLGTSQWCKGCAWELKLYPSENKKRLLQHRIQLMCALDAHTDTHYHALLKYLTQTTRPTGRCVHNKQSQERGHWLPQKYLFYRYKTDLNLAR